jgi:hypothetical protein
VTLAFALVASAAAWRQCTALQLAAMTSIGHGSHAAHDHAGTAAHGEHDHHAMHHQDAADEPAAPEADDHGCMKCCTMCTVANALPPAVSVTLAFTVSAHIFSRNDDPWLANTIAVDPGIPKRTG